MDQLIEAIRLADQFITKTDQINRRLVTATIVITISLSVTIMFIVGSYFFSNYQYPDVSQSVKSQSQEVIQSVK